MRRACALVADFVKIFLAEINTEILPRCFLFAGAKNPMETTKALHNCAVCGRTFNKVPHLKGDAKDNKRCMMCVRFYPKNHKCRVRPGGGGG